MEMGIDFGPTTDRKASISAAAESMFCIWCMDTIQVIATALVEPG